MEEIIIDSYKELSEGIITEEACLERLCLLQMVLNIGFDKFLLETEKVRKSFNSSLVYKVPKKYVPVEVPYNCSTMAGSFRRGNFDPFTGSD